MPAKKAVKWATGTAQPAQPSAQARQAAAGSSKRPDPKPVRLQWGPSNIHQRVTINQAEKALRSAQLGAQRNAKAVEQDNADREQQEQRNRD